MVFLTALCHYNEIPQDFHLIDDVDCDKRIVNDVVREWSPFHTDTSNVQFDCHVFVNGRGHLPVSPKLRQGTLQNLIAKLVETNHVKIPQDSRRFSIFLRVKFHTRMNEREGNNTRSDYWFRNPWVTFREKIENASGEYKTRLLHDYVMELKSKIRNCTCQVCKLPDFDRDQILTISDLQISEMFEIWNIIKKSGDKEEYIWSFFEDSCVGIQKKDIFQLMFSFLNVNLCFFGLANLIGCGQYVAERTIVKWMKSFQREEEKADEESLEDQNTGSRKRRRIETRKDIHKLTPKGGWCWGRQTRTSVTCQFLKDYMEFFIEYPPDESRPRLPLFVKREVYDNEYAFFMKAMLLAPVSYKWFNMIWKKQFGHCMMTDKRRFGQCNRCAELNRLYTLACRTPDTVQSQRELLLIKSAHVEMIRNYRRLVTTWMKMADRDPQKHLFVMMDGMDQNKTGLPSEGRHRKSREGKNLYGVKLTNALTNHGNFFFWQDGSLKSTSNQIMFMLDLIFEHVKQTNGSLPRNLYLVFDSCSVNKSRKLFTFLSSFVAYSIFDEIQLIFLPVGHTHWFNDQIFSIIARKFYRTSCCIQSIADFESFLTFCYQPQWFQDLQKEKPVSERVLFESHVRQLEFIPDYTPWTQNFETSNMKNMLVQGRNRFEFFGVNRPESDDILEVQINSYVNSFTVEQMIQTYYSTSVHGIFGNICLERVEKNFEFSDNRIAQLYRDFYFQVNQPVQHFVIEFWPDLNDELLRDNMGNNLPTEDFKILNLSDVHEIVHEADYKQNVVQDWELRVFVKNENRKRVQCPICQNFQTRDAEIHVAGRHIANEEEKEAVKESKKARSKLREELQLHLISEEHVSVVRWNFLSRIRTLQGNDETFDSEVFEAFLRNEDSTSWKNKLFAKIGMFSNVSLMRKRLEDLNLQNCDLLNKFDMQDLSHVQDISSFFINIRGWHIQDGNTHWDHMGPQDILAIFRKYCVLSNDEPLQTIPQPLERNFAYLDIDKDRMKWKCNVDYSKYHCQLSTHRLSRPYILSCPVEEEKDVEMKDVEMPNQQQLPSCFRDMQWVDDYSFLNECAEGRSLRDKLFRLNQLRIDERKMLVGKSLMLLTPGNMNALKRNDRQTRRISALESKKWWKDVVPNCVSWKYRQGWCKPSNTSRSSISQNIMIFLILGFEHDLVFGHWMISNQNARVHQAESCWKRKLIPTSINKTPGKIISSDVVSSNIRKWIKTGHHISCFHVDILNELLLWTPPFELVPVHSMENVHEPCFSIPIRLIPFLRKQHGWEFVYDVFKM